MKLFKILTIILISIVLINGCKKDAPALNASIAEDNSKNIIKVPLTRQAFDYTCGASAFQSVLYYHGIEYMESELATLLESDTINGTRYQNIVSLATSLDFNVEIKQNASFNDLKNYLDFKKPVLVLIQAWPEQDNVDWKNDWIDGHYAVAIGYDQNNVYLMDPSTLGNYTYIPQPEFMDRWHDIDGSNDTLRHFILSIQQETLPMYNCDGILKLD